MNETRRKAFEFAGKIASEQELDFATVIIQVKIQDGKLIHKQCEVTETYK
ncbi:MAG: hypothetical protein WC998_06350 [Candidatus Paceibacterota bacterium]|jgi:hypothetical protein